MLSYDCLRSLKVGGVAALPGIYRASPSKRIFHAHERDNMGGIFHPFQKGVLLLFPQ